MQRTALLLRSGERLLPTWQQRGIVQSCTCRTERLSTNKQIRIDSLEASVCLGEEFFCKEHAEPAERNGKHRQQD